MSLLDELSDVIRDGADDWSDADRDAAVQIAKDLGKLMASDLRGDPVDQSELAIAQASARNIATAAVLTGAAALRDAIWRWAKKLLAAI
jgi:hypothetical protein